jgi:hypothetical protein
MFTDTALDSVSTDDVHVDRVDAAILNPNG